MLPVLLKPTLSFLYLVFLVFEILAFALLIVVVVVVVVFDSLYPLSCISFHFHSCFACGI